MSDPVSHPSHYTQGEYKCKHCGKQIECIHILQWMTYNIGAAMKYLWRYKDKGNPVQDLQKAKQYIDFEIAKLKVNEPEVESAAGLTEEWKWIDGFRNYPTAGSIVDLYDYKLSMYGVKDNEKIEKGCTVVKYTLDYMTRAGYFWYNYIHYIDSTGKEQVVLTDKLKWRPSTLEKLVQPGQDYNPT